MDGLSFRDQQVDSKRILYTPSVFARNNLFYLQEAGELHARAPHKNQRVNLDSYLFFIVVQGEGHLEYGKTRSPLHQGDCVFIDCREAYAHTTSDCLWTLKWTHFDGPTLSGVYQKYVERGGKPCFHPSDAGRYIQLLTEIHQTAALSDYVRDMRLHEKISRLLTFLMEESRSAVPPDRSSHGEPVVHAIRSYLDENFAKKIALDELAEMFFFNKYYLTRIFKQQFGTSIMNYVLYRRIAQAKQLLRFTPNSIEAVAEACGLQDSNYFARAFRKVEGMSPREYRKRW